MYKSTLLYQTHRTEINTSEDQLLTPKYSEKNGMQTGARHVVVRFRFDKSQSDTEEWGLMHHAPPSSYIFLIYLTNHPHPPTFPFNGMVPHSSSLSIHTIYIHPHPNPQQRSPSFTAPASTTTTHPQCPPTRRRPPTHRRSRTRPHTPLPYPPPTTTTTISQPSSTGSSPSPYSATPSTALLPDTSISATGAL